MIPRYSRPEMVAIWSPETRFRIWFEIEAHACDAMAQLGVIPQANADAVWTAAKADFNVARIDEIEAVTKHDVIAFLTHLGEIIGPDQARFVHQGMTSSDVLDTCFNIQLVRAADLLIADLLGTLGSGGVWSSTPEPILHARGMLEGVLDEDPDNYHALLSLSRTFLFDAEADGERLGLQQDFFRGEQSVDVARRVTGGEDHGITGDFIASGGDHAADVVL